LLITIPLAGALAAQITPLAAPPPPSMVVGAGPSAVAFRITAWTATHLDDGSTMLSVECEPAGLRPGESLEICALSFTAGGAPRYRRAL
jgi:hypothetical protein